MISLESTDAENSIQLWKSPGKSPDDLMISLDTNDEANSIRLWNLQGKIGIDLSSVKNVNYVYLFDQQEERAAGLFADDDEKYGNGVFAIDKTRKK